MSISTRCWCYQKGRKDAHLEPALSMGSGGFTPLSAASHEYLDDKINNKRFAANKKLQQSKSGN